MAKNADMVAMRGTMDDDQATLYLDVWYKELSTGLVKWILGLEIDARDPIPAQITAKCSTNGVDFA
jgi:hypothetical protein